MVKILVSLEKCESYEYSKVKSAIEKSFENLGGIEKFIKKSTKYERTERQDILFYVLYATVISILNKNNINDNDIKNLNLDLITNELLIDIREKIYDKYKSLGGNSTVAKNKDFVNEIDKIILK